VISGLSLAVTYIYMERERVREREGAKDMAT
jgi:hypothetical protein